jgi:hypothetical protein
VEKATESKFKDSLLDEVVSSNDAKTMPTRGSLDRPMLLQPQNSVIHKSFDSFKKTDNFGSRYKFENEEDYDRELDFNNVLKSRPEREKVDEDVNWLVLHNEKFYYLFFFKECLRFLPVGRNVSTGSEQERAKKLFNQNRQRKRFLLLFLHYTVKMVDWIALHFPKCKRE